MPVFRPLQRPQLWSTSGYVCKSCRHKLLIARSQFSRSQANLSPADSDGAGGDDWFSNFNNLSIESDGSRKPRVQGGRIASPSDGDGKSGESPLSDTRRAVSEHGDRGDGEQSEKDDTVSKFYARPQIRPFTTADAFPHGQDSSIAGLEKKPTSLSPASIRTRDAWKAEMKSIRLANQDNVQVRGRRENRAGRGSRRRERARSWSAKLVAEARGPENKETRRQFEATLEGLSKTINDMLNNLWNGEKKTASDPGAEKDASSENSLRHQPMDRGGGGNNSAENEIHTTSLSYNKVPPRSTAEDDDSLPWYLRAPLTKSSSSSKGEPAKVRRLERSGTSPWGMSARTDEPPRPPEEELPQSNTDGSVGYIPFAWNSGVDNSSSPSSKAESAESIADELMQAVSGGLKIRADEQSLSFKPALPGTAKVAEYSPWGLKARPDKPPEDSQPKPIVVMKVTEAPWGLQSPTENLSPTTEDAPPNETAESKLAELSLFTERRGEVDVGQTSEPSNPLADLKSNLTAELGEKSGVEVESQPSSTLDHVENGAHLGDESSVEVSSQLSSPLAQLENNLSAELGEEFVDAASTGFSDDLPAEVLLHDENDTVALDLASELRDDGVDDEEKISSIAVAEPSTIPDEADSETADVHSSAVLTQDLPVAEIEESAVDVAKSQPTEEKIQTFSPTKDFFKSLSKVNENTPPEDEALRTNENVPNEPGEELFRSEKGHPFSRKDPYSTNHATLANDPLMALLDELEASDRSSTNRQAPVKKYTSFSKQDWESWITERPSTRVTKVSISDKNPHVVENDNAPPLQGKSTDESKSPVENASVSRQRKGTNESKVSESFVPRRGIATVARRKSFAKRRANSKGGDNNGHKSFSHVHPSTQALAENTTETSSQTPSAVDGQQATVAGPPLDLSSSDTADVSTVKPAQLIVEPLNIPQRPVPSLEYGLDRVLFNSGIYQLQDPHSRVYNFDPYLQKIMPVVEFDFNALKEYKTSSQDKTLATLARDHKKRYIGSTSSMTGMLGHFHYLLSDWRPLNLNMFSKGFPEKNDAFTLLNRAPNAIFLRWKNGTYAIDADKQYDSGNILMLLGKSMEKLLTMPTSEYERYRKSDPRTVSEEDRTAPETFEYTTMGDFLMRSQLDAHDPRLPGTGMFDLKTRAVVTVRMNADDFEPMTGYEIEYLQGRFKSYEREFYDMMRSTMLKYSLQARMGRMDGIFIAYHNVERIFGFQYVPIQEMDRAIHGQWGRCLGDQEFKTSLKLMNDVLDRATAKFPEQSLRFHFETTTETTESDGLTTVMWIFAEPMSDDEIDAIQSESKAKVAEFEKTMMGVEKPSEEMDSTEEKDSDTGPSSQTTNVSTSDLKTSNSGGDTEFLDSIANSDVSAMKPLFAASLIAKSHVNGEPVARPTRLKDDDVWEVEYTLHEWEESSDMWTRYAMMKSRRRELFSRHRSEDENPEDGENGNGDGELTFQQRRERSYIDFLKSMSQSGRDFRSMIDRIEAGKEPVVVGQELREEKGVVEEKVENVDEYMAWLYGKE